MNHIVKEVVEGFMTTNIHNGTFLPELNDRDYVDSLSFEEFIAYLELRKKEVSSLKKLYLNNAAILNYRNILAPFVNCRRIVVTEESEISVEDFVLLLYLHRWY